MSWRFLCIGANDHKCGKKCVRISGFFSVCKERLRLSHSGLVEVAAGRETGVALSDDCSELRPSEKLPSTVELCGCSFD